MRVRLGALVFAIATLFAAGPAFGADFGVTGTADSLSGSCGAVDPTTGLRPCTTLRAAVDAANTSPDAEDNIVLTVGGTYALSQGELVLQNGVSLFGTGARGVTISSATSRVLHVPAGADVIVAGVTIADGIVAADGGNILNEGNLELFQTHILGGQATDGSGGGISNIGGTLSVVQSLIEDNTTVGSGGGIDNQSGNLDVSDSTFAGNSGNPASAIGISGTSSVELTHVTFNFNVPGTTLFIANSGQNVGAFGSIFTTNVASTALCGPIKPIDRGFNVDRGTSCAFGGTSVSNVDPQVSGGLVNRGGPTDLFSIEPSSPAAGLVATCGSGLDQRGYLRSPTFFEPCDAGAYEIGGQPIVPDPPPPPPPPPPVPTPVPPGPAATPTPTPLAGQSVAAKPISGTVLVKLPGSSKFVELDPSVIKNGAEIDARKGVIELTRSDGDKAKFFDGIFKLSQPNGITTVTLSEKLDCKKSSGGGKAAAKKPKKRKLWGDGKGKFRTRGQYAAATVRGTKWLVEDTCTTTTTRVTQGSVEVQDLVKKKKFLIRKGKNYVARAKR